MGEGGGCQWISLTHTHAWSRSSLLWQGGADGEEKKSGGEKRCEGGGKEERRKGGKERNLRMGGTVINIKRRVRGVRGVCGVSACVVLVLDEQRNYKAEGKSK